MRGQICRIVLAVNVLIMVMATDTANPLIATDQLTISSIFFCLGVEQCLLKEPDLVPSLPLLLLVPSRFFPAACVTRCLHCLPSSCCAQYKHIGLDRQPDNNGRKKIIVGHICLYSFYFIL